MGVDGGWAAGRLEAQAAVIAALAAGVAGEQARWRPAAGEWSLLEVVNHLADEEAEDFRARVDVTLHRPGEAAPPIDPAGWVTARAYNERALDESLARFLAERRRSLDWLRSLADPDWARPITHPHLTLQAGDLLAAWVAHDLLHIRQLNELHYRWQARQAAPYGVDYAGDW